jgi:UDP-glucose 4-epimerase
MKILVTGGAGFVGSHIVKKLIELNHTVITLDDLSTGKQAFINEVVHHPNHTFVNGSVLNRALLENLIDPCDIVFHLAAVLGVKNTVENPLMVIEGNIDGTRNVLELAFPRKIKVIFSSTSEVYGKNDQLPFAENSSRVLGPTTTHRWCYATAKALDEHLCFAYGMQGLPVTVVRYFIAYGPRATATQYGGVIPKFITAALKGEPITVYGDCSQTSCFTYIDNRVSGTLSCIDHKFNNEVFNIGKDQVLSINDLAEKIKTFTQSSSPIVHIPYESTYGEGYEDTPNRIPDLTKFNQLLHFYPSIDIDEGLRKTIAWYQAELEKGQA